MEPPPELMLIIRGVEVESLKSGANASVTKNGPVEFVWKH